MQIDLIQYDMSTWDHVLAVIICVLAPVLAFTSRKITTEDIHLNSDDKIRLYHSNGLLLVVFALIIATAWRLPGRPLSGLGFNWPEWHPYIPFLLLMVFLFYGLDIFFQYGNKKRREQTLERRHKSMAFVPADGKEMFHFLFLAIAAGIGEEIIFRGYLIHYLVSWSGNSTSGILLAALGSSTLFAFLHGYQGLASITKIFFVALLFSAIFIFSKSLLLVIIIHAVIDMVSGFISVHMLKETSGLNDQ